MAKKDRTQDGLHHSVRGTGKQVRGRVKDAVGGLTGDAELQAEGKIDQAAGKVQRAVGRAERKLGRKR
jgi:uncharacterized protein YjbJ (UPF0337 family)